MILNLIFLLSVILKLSLEAQSNVNYQNRVLGGHSVTAKEYPYLARIEAKGMCSGALISHHYVLTAAHCIPRNPKVKVRLGIENASDHVNGTEISCRNCTEIYPEYLKNHKVDLGLIKLPTYVNFTDRIKAVQLPSYGDVRDMSGEIGTVTGWGMPKYSPNHTALNGLSYFPLSGDATILNKETCVMIHTAILMGASFSDEFCILHLQTGTLSGDSGGPFVVNNKLVGITIRTTAPTSLYPDFASGFVNVTKFLKWIDENSDITIGQHTNMFP